MDTAQTEATDDKSSLGVLTLLLAAFFWATLGVSTKLVESNYSATLLASVRGLATAGALILSLRTVQFSLSFRGLMAATTYAMTSLTLMLALKGTGAGISFLLQNATPVYVPVLAYLINREGIKKRDVCASALVALGLVCVMVVESFSIPLAYGVTSGFLWALTIVLHKKLDKIEGSVSYIVGNIFFLPTMFTIEGIGSAPWFDLALLVFGVGVIGSAIPAVLFLWGIKRSSSSTLSSLVLGSEPFIAAFLAYFILGEKQGFGTMICGATLVISLIVQTDLIYRRSSFRYGTRKVSWK